MQMKVAPFAGAWIEMYLCGILRLRSESLPSRERGLKSDDMAGIIRSNAVAPFAGAWIEIRIKSNHKTSYIVAPFAGAWIEI